METIKLCRFIGETFPDGKDIYGGLIPNYYNLSTELAKFGVETTILCPYKEGQKLHEDKNGFTVERFRLNNSKLSSIAFNFGMNKKAYKQSLKIEKDIVQLHNFYGYWFQKKVQVPNVLTVHGCDIELFNANAKFPTKLDYRSIKNKLDSRKTLFLSKRMSKNADLVVGVSKGVSNEIKEYWKVNPKKTISIYNGINYNSFKRKKSDVMTKYSDTFNILYVGRITPLKGINYLFDAINNIKNVCLFVIGASTVHEEYFQQILQKVKDKKKIILIGKIPHNELAKYYSAADCMVLPSLGEGFPKVILEAMAAECPVISSNIPGSNEIVNEKTGWLFKRENPKDLESKIRFVIDNYGEAKKRARNARELVKTYFTWEIAAKKYAKAYKKLV